MSIRIAVILLIISISTSYSQNKRIINAFIELNHYEENDYIIFKVKNNDDEILPLISILRVGCSNCYDYLIFENKNTTEIFDPIEIKKINKFASHFLKNVSNNDYYYYLNTIINKYQDAVKIRELRSKNTSKVIKAVKK